MFLCIRFGCNHQICNICRSLPTSILAQLLPKHILFRYFVSCDSDSSYNSTWIFRNCAGVFSR